MAVKIRFFQTGKRNLRSFRIVAIDESKKREGSIIEQLGTVNTQTKPVKINLNQERIDYWLKTGAKPTLAVAKILANKL